MLLRLPALLVVFLPAAAIAALLAACGADLQEPPRAPVAPSAEARPGVSAEGAVDVEVSVGAGPSVRIECDADLLPGVHVEEHAGTVRVWTDSSWNAADHGPCTVFLRRESLHAVAVSGSGDVRVRGPAPDLGAIDASGSGDVAVDDAGASEMQLAVSGSGDIVVTHAAPSGLSIDVSGSGTVRIAGTAESATIALSGSGDLDARSLSVRDAMVSLSGSGDAAVHVSERVTVSAAGSGDVKIAGQPPQRIVARDGSGEVAFE